MGYIRETELKKGGVRYQAEVRLKGMPALRHGGHTKPAKAHHFEMVALIRHSKDLLNSLETS